MTEDSAAGWSFLTNHARVLVCIAHDSGIRLRDIGEARVEIAKADAYDLIGRVVEILPRPAPRNALFTPTVPPVETLTRIATGAPLRILS